MPIQADDLILLTHLVEGGSFTSASTRTGVSKSLLSRRLIEMETRLGVRLIERTTRSFHVTEIGNQLYQHGLAIRAERDTACALVDDVLCQPRGTLCIICPVVLAEKLIGEIAVAFAIRYPLVELTFDTGNESPNTYSKHYDIAFLPSSGVLPDSETIARRLITTPYELVASPKWIEQSGNPRTVEALNGLTGVVWWQTSSKSAWQLTDENGKRHEVTIQSGLITNNLAIVKKAAISGIGMARLPLAICRDDLLSGRLQRVISGVTPDPIMIHVAYSSRTSLTAAGRAFLMMLEEASTDLLPFGGDNHIRPRRTCKPPKSSRSV